MHQNRTRNNGTTRAIPLQTKSQYKLWPLRLDQNSKRKVSESPTLAPSHPPREGITECGKIQLLTLPAVGSSQLAGLLF